MTDDELCEAMQTEMLADPADSRKFDIGVPILIERHYALMDSNEHLERKVKKFSDANHDLIDKMKILIEQKQKIENDYSEIKEKVDFLNSLIADDPELEDNSLNNKIKKKTRLWWKWNYHRPPKDEHLNKATEVAINETLKGYRVDGEE